MTPGERLQRQVRAYVLRNADRLLAESDRLDTNGDTEGAEEWRELVDLCRS